MYSGTRGIKFERYNSAATEYNEVYIRNNIFNVTTKFMWDAFTNITLDNCLIYGNETYGIASDISAITNPKAFKFSLASQVAGDIMYFNGTDWIKLAKGTAGQVLTMNAGATAPEWQTP